MAEDFQAARSTVFAGSAAFHQFSRFLRLCLFDTHFIWSIRVLLDLIWFFRFVWIRSIDTEKGRATICPALSFFMSVLFLVRIFGGQSVPPKMRLRGLFHRITATGAADRLRQFAWHLHGGPALFTAQTAYKIRRSVCFQNNMIFVLSIPAPALMNGQNGTGIGVGIPL